MFDIVSLQTVIRRNKRNEPCARDWANHDNLLLQRHLEKVGCRAPYYKSNLNFPICNTFEQMKKCHIDMWYLPKGYDIVPCQYIVKIPYRYSKRPSLEKRKRFKIVVTYPKNLQTVKHSQAVDFHSLIGNIGGYIGLFMGNLRFA